MGDKSPKAKERQQKQDISHKQDVKDAAFAKSAKPFAVALTPAADKSLALLTAAGVPAFRHPESCAEAMALCLLRKPPQQVPALQEPSVAALGALEAGRVSGFDERRAADLFAALGVSMAKSVAVPEVASFQLLFGPVEAAIHSPLSKPVTGQMIGVNAGHWFNG